MHEVWGMAALWNLTPRFFKKYGDRPSELEAKYLLLFLFGLGALAVWTDSEAVLPAYVIGMVLAGTVGKNHVLIRRLILVISTADGLDLLLNSKRLKATLQF